MYNKCEENGEKFIVALPTGLARGQQLGWY
jgi:hypothetical protein